MDVKDALKMYEEYKTHWYEIYEAAKDDLRFSIGEGQWSDNDKKLRGKRPCLTVNVLPQFIHQVTNQIRQNTPSIMVLPGDAKSSIETAKALKGLIRNIEYRSGADEVYDTAAEYSVTSSLGFILVDHDYIDPGSEDQELLIKRVENPLSWWLDPNSIECDGSDAMGAIGLTTISKADFKSQFPGKNFISFEGNPKADDKRETITIAHVYKKTLETIGKSADGKRDLKKVVIKRYLFSGEDELKSTTFPGEYIPLVPVYGQEVWVDDKRNLISLIRQSKDPQRRYNHWASVEAEILSKSPIAPIMYQVGTIEDVAEPWQNPSVAMGLPYNGTDVNGQPANKPERLMPPPVPVGIINAMQGAYEDIKRSMGLYDASVGQKSNETSGVAIENRKEQGNVATFHFADNLSRSIAQVGRILVCAIPTIYETPRIVQIIGDEEEPKFIGINDPRLMVEGQKEPYDLTTGKYDVRVVTGPSFVNKQQEMTAVLGEVLKAKPELMGVFGDVWLKGVPGAEAAAARVRKTIPKELTADEGDEEAPTPKEMQLERALQQADQQMQMMAQEFEKSGVQTKQMEQQTKAAELELKAHEIGLKEQAEITKAENERMKMALEAEKLQIERERLELEKFKAKNEAALAAHTAMNPPAAEETAEPSAPMLDPNAPDEALMAHMNARREKQMKEQELAAQQAAEVQAEKEAEAQERAIDQALKEAQIKVSLDMGNAIVQAMQGISAQLNELSAREPHPMQVVRDESGRITGLVPDDNRLN